MSSCPLLAGRRHTAAPKAISANRFVSHRSTYLRSLRNKVLAEEKIDDYRIEKLPLDRFMIIIKLQFLNGLRKPLASKLLHCQMVHGTWNIEHGHGAWAWGTVLETVGVTPYGTYADCEC
jgi:hypothetical protein